MKDFLLLDLPYLPTHPPTYLPAHRRCLPCWWRGPCCCLLGGVNPKWLLLLLLLRFLFFFRGVLLLHQASFSFCFFFSFFLPV